MLFIRLIGMTSKNTDKKLNKYFTTFQQIAKRAVRKFFIKQMIGFQPTRQKDSLYFYINYEIAVVNKIMSTMLSPYVINELVLLKTSCQNIKNIEAN